MKSAIHAVVIASTFLASTAAADTIETDLLIVGGTESGCAAAVQAARMGVERIVLVNDIEWLGGQFSAEALTAIDENTYKTGVRHQLPFPRSGLFKEVMDRIEAINLKKYGVRRPGNTRVITTCLPADAERAFRDLIRPYVDSGQIKIISNYYPVAAALDDAGTTLRSVQFKSTQSGQPELTVAAKLTIDASDWGDAIKAAGAEYEFGPDLKSKYNEPLAPPSRDGYPLTDMNPITYGMTLVESDEYEPITKPAQYDERNYRGDPKKAASITYLDWRYPNDVPWLYESRRLVDHYGFKQIDHPDVVLLCFPAVDYPLDVWPRRVADALEATEPGTSKKNIAELTYEQRQIVFDDAKQYSLGFLYYLQTAVHDRMADKTHSFRRFKLSDEFGTPDRVPPKPYARESLRLKSMYMMRQQDTTGHGGDSNNFARVMYHDGVACWQFEYDFHPTGRRFIVGGDPSGPWQSYFRKGRTWGPPYSGKSLFPLRSLVPEKIDGLLGGQKNLGYSSIVSAAVRLHDTSMAIGQAGGAAAAVAIHNEVQPRAIPFDAALLSQVHRGLCSRLDGGEPQMLWPFADVATDHPAFEAINLLAARRGLPLAPTEVDFRPDDPADTAWRNQVVALSLETKITNDPPQVPAGNTTRGEFAQAWWAKIKDLPDRPFTRVKPNDADNDGLDDRDDALPLEAKSMSW